MRIDEIGPKVYDLITTMLSEQVELIDVPLVEAYSNAPRPDEAIYIAYNANPRIRRIGQEIKIDATLTEPVKHRQDYEVSVTVREIGGYGQYLQMIENMQYDQGVKVFLYNELLSILRIGEIVPTPRLLDDDRWERESAMEMILAITHILSDATTYIETVEFNNNIGE